MTDYLQLAETALRKGEKDKWSACLICAYKVGDHTNGFAHDLADRMGYEVSRISDFADAGKAWMQLCRYMRVSDRDRFRIDVFTKSYHVIKKGNEPHKVAEVLLDYAQERDKFKMQDVKDALDITFNIPPKEVNPLRYVEHLESWGERLLDHADRAAWLATTRTQRDIIRKHSGK